MVDASLREELGLGVLDLDQVLDQFRGWLYLPDARSVEVALATYVAHHRPGEPLWVALLGASGGGKTEPLRSLDALPDSYMLSKLTPQTFLSGLKGNRRASLLFRLQDDGKSFILMKDFTSILSMNRDQQRELLADLREIYDGALHKDYGSGESHHWEGRLGLLCGVTPAMDTARKVNELMGERFLYWRLPEVNRAELSSKALEGRGMEQQMREALSGIVTEFLGALDFTRAVPLSEGANGRLKALANLATWARSGVQRDRSHEVLTIPIAEAPTRFVKQLGALTEALMVLGRPEDVAMEFAEKISRDSIPPNRMSALDQLVRADASVSTAEIANAVHLPITTCKHVLEDLTALRLARRTGSGQDLRWSVTEEPLSLWRESGLGETAPETAPTLLAQGGIA